MSMMDLIREDLRQFAGYESARKQFSGGSIFLNANESPWPSEDGEPGLNRYPEPQPTQLRNRLAEIYQVDSSRILIGRGSDELIDLLVRGFCRTGLDAIVQSPPTFGMYRVSAQLQGAKVIDVPLLIKNNFQIDLDQVLASITEQVKIVFVCSPNNPSGGAVSSDDLQRIAKACEGRALLVVDRAYCEFELNSKPNFDHLDWLNAQDHVVQLRTLSKAYGLAGARIGVAIANPSLIQFIARLMPPYPISTPSAGAALSALAPQNLAVIHNRVALLKNEREKLFVALHRSTAVSEVFASEGNFILARFNNADQFYARALNAGFVLRKPSIGYGLEHCLRISIGLPSENAQFITLLNEAA